LTAFEQAFAVINCHLGTTMIFLMLIGQTEWKKVLKFSQCSIMFSVYDMTCSVMCRFQYACRLFAIQIVFSCEKRDHWDYIVWMSAAIGLDIHMTDEAMSRSCLFNLIILTTWSFRFMASVLELQYDHF